jgi:ribosomal protein S18 acetylase RimI-like enzyme
LPVGLVSASFDPRENAHLKKNRGFLLGLGVLKAYRGQGIAKALLIRGMQALKESGMEETDLTVDDENPVKAIRIYLGLGFQVVRKILSYERAV